MILIWVMVITGIGVISPLGDSAAALGAALAAGQSGLAPVELFDPGDLACREAGEIRGFSPRDYLGDGNLRPLDRSAQLVAAAELNVFSVRNELAAVRSEPSRVLMSRNAACCA